MSTGVTTPTNVAVPVPESYTNSYDRCFQLEPRLSKDDVVYVEMHATGTIRGDKAELGSIKYYAEGRENGGRGSSGKNKTLWLGGNKSIFGHTEPVSGLLSIAKLLMAFEKGVVPPTLLITDPALDLDDMTSKNNVEIVSSPLSMESLEGGLFAVTASGMSGTTTHVIFRPPSQPDFPKRAFTSHGDKIAWPPMVVISTHSTDSCKTWR